MKKHYIKLKKYLPTILSFLSCGGVIGTAVLAVKNHEKAKEIKLNKIFNANEENPYELSNKEEIRSYLKAQIPTILMGTGTMICILGANSLNKHYQTALISAYGLLNESFKDYRNKVIEFHGQEEHKRIINSIAAEKAKATYINHGMFSNESLNSDTLSKNDKEQLFYDCFSKRYFTSTLASVIQAEYHVNRNWCLGSIVLLNDWYKFLGIEQTVEGNELGWYMAAEDDYFWLDFSHDLGYLEDGTEFIAIIMDYEPNLNWQGEYSGFRYEIEED